MQHTLLAADSDNGLIQVMREPGFGQWVVYGFVAFMLIKQVVMAGLKGFETVNNYVNRNKVLNMPQPLNVQEAPVPADRKEVKENVSHLAQQIADLRKDMMIQLAEHGEMEESRHKERALAGEHRVQNLSQVIETACKRLEDRLDKETAENRRGRGELHEKCNQVAKATVALTAELPHVNQAINRLEVRLSNEIPGVHKRVDDCLKIAADAVAEARKRKQ